MENSEVEVLGKPFKRPIGLLDDKISGCLSAATSLTTHTPWFLDPVRTWSQAANPVSYNASHK